VGLTTWVPDSALVPDQPTRAVHEVAFVDDHVRVAGWPATTDVGDAEKLIVVGGTTVTVTD